MKPRTVPKKIAQLILTTSRRFVLDRNTSYYVIDQVISPWSMTLRVRATNVDTREEEMFHLSPNIKPLCERKLPPTCNPWAENGE